MNLIKLRFFAFAAILAAFSIYSCEGPEGPAGAQGPAGADGADGAAGADGADGQDLTLAEMVPLTESVIPASIFKLSAEFSNADLQMVMTSADILESDPTFVYGSYMDGAALYKADSCYYFVNNLEADYSIARITMNSQLQPLCGEYIINAVSTGYTAQCSGSSITQEEHGFGPYYLSGGEWGGDQPGVYLTDPFKPSFQADFSERLTSMGEWATENAVVIGKDAYSSKTVAFIGDDDSNNTYPESHFAMYVGDRGDVYNGDLFVLRGKDTTENVRMGGLKFEMGMDEGVTYDVEWVPVTERSKDELNQEAIDSVAIGFQRIEDIDWRRGSAENQRTLYFCVTGRRRSDNPDLANRGTTFGRIYKLELDANDPTADAKITCVLDGDKVGGTADGFHSPDNILVTENYAYIQEDPNGYADANPAISGYAKLYQYDLNNGTLKTVLECDQVEASAMDIGNTSSMWEITGLIDVTDIIGATESTFLGGAQVHGWRPVNNPETAKRADGAKFYDPTAIDGGNATLEGSALFKITGLAR